MPVIFLMIFLIPWRRKTPKPQKVSKTPAVYKPARQRKRGPNLAGLGKNLMRFRHQARSRINTSVTQRASGAFRLTPPPPPPRNSNLPKNTRPNPTTDPGVLLADFFAEPTPNLMTDDFAPDDGYRTTSVAQAAADGGFEIPETLADLGVAPRPRTTARVSRFQTPAGRTFVSRDTENATTTIRPPTQNDFDLDLSEGPYVSMFETVSNPNRNEPETVADQLRRLRPDRNTASTLADLDVELLADDDQATVALPPGELVQETTYDPNRRGLRRRGGPRRAGIKFRNPALSLAVGFISVIMLALMVFLIIFISGSVNRAPTGKYAVMFVPFGNGATYAAFNEGQLWNKNLGTNLLNNAGVPDLDIRYGGSIIKDGAGASRQAQSSDTDVLVWGYNDNGRNKLVTNLVLTPNGPYDPPVGRGRQLVERHLYDPEQMVFVTQQPTDPSVPQPLSQLLNAIGAYYNGNYDSALAGLSELISKGEAENEPGLRLLRGNVLFLFGRYAEAIEDYNQVININNVALRNNLPTPVNSAYVYNNRAAALSFQGNYGEANKSFTTALSINDKAPKIFTNYAQFLLDHTDMESRPNLLTDWQSKLTNVTKLDPKSAAAFHFLGRVDYYLGDYDAAITSENQARQLDQNYLEVYLWQGQAIIAKGQRDRQLPVFSGALDVLHWGESRATGMETQNRQRWQSLNENGNQTLAAVWDTRARDANSLLDAIRFQIARVYLEQTRLTGTDTGNPLDKLGRAVRSAKTPFEEAGPRLSDYLKNHPDNPDANFYYGQFLDITNSGDPAPYYQKAKDLEKDLNRRFKYQQMLAEQYAAAGKRDEAIAQYTEFIQLDKNRPTAYLALSSLQYRFGLYREAAISADSAIKLDSKNAFAYLAAGAAQVGNQQFQQAIAYLDRALVLNPNLAEAHLQRAMALFRLNRRQEALDAFSRALALNDNYPMAHFFAGIIYQENLNDNKSALTEWQKTVALDLRYSEAWVKLGLTYSQIGQLDQAVEAYNHALAANDNDAPTHYFLGLLYEGRNTPDGLAQAEKHYRRAIQITPGLVNAYYRLALVIRLQGGKADDALAMAVNATQLDAKSPEAQVVLGDIYRARSEFENAVKPYNAALSLRKDYPEALYGRAATYLGLKQNDPALNDINRALQLRSQWAEAYILQGQILIAKKDLNGAINSYNTARSLNPNNADLFAEMGSLAELRQQPDEAISDYEKSLGQYEPNVGIHFKLGELYFIRRSFEQARQQFERVRQLSESWPRINYWLGRTYAFLNRPAEAQVALEKMVQQEPNFVEAHLELGNVYRTKNQRDAALAQYDEAIKVAQSGYPPAWLNKGQILEDMVNIPKAIEAYKNAQVSTDPQIRDAATAALRRLGAK